ncbi:MAG: Undecaprenyl-phosphate 4-deoxy-4-formamido-L-arabinose transferase [Candidatus Omnitrophica bacterium]|nr:Undecaprenyl-phosphate 4-deoxy-4-formamido-L-arabinose transferase [Candidatus Omnitrophota bacterium]
MTPSIPVAGPPAEAAVDDALETRYRTLSIELDAAKRVIEDFAASRSWRWTAPLRWLSDRLGRGGGGTGGVAADTVATDGRTLAGRPMFTPQPGIDARRVRERLQKAAAARRPVAQEPHWSPTVSVVIPHFNAGADLDAAVDSVLLSSYTDYEIIIADDGSSDGSDEAVRRQTHKDPRIRAFFGCPKQGPAAARNRAVEAARGRYILPLDADNFIEPDLIGECVKALDAAPDRFVYPHLYQFRADGRTAKVFVPQYDYEELKKANYIDTCAMYRRDHWVEAGGYKRGIDGYEDWEFWIQLGKMGVTGQRLEMHGFWYQVRPMSMVWNARRRHRVYHERIRSFHPEVFAASRADSTSPAAPALPASVRVEHLRRRLERKSSELTAAYATIGRFERSVSWRITAPLRRAHDALLPLVERLGARLSDFERLLFMGRGPMRLRSLTALGTLCLWLSMYLRRRYWLSGIRKSWCPYVSIVIPNYNHARHLRESVMSALTQSLRGIEVVVVDDGSTDGSRRLLRDLARRHSKLRVVYHDSNRGLAAARNTGILAARGRYIVPLDADNLLDPAMAATCLNHIEKHGQGFVYTDLYRFGKRTVRVETPEYSLERLAEANYIDACAMFRKADWEDAGGYKADVPGYEDWEFWLHLGKQGISGRRVPKPLFYYRVNPSSMLTATVARHREHQRTLRALHPEVFL